MRKIFPILIVCFLIISGFGALGINIEKTNKLETETLSKVIEIEVSLIKIQDNGKKYIEVSIDNEELYLMNPGQPMIPRILTTYELPFGVTNIEVKAEPIEVQETVITKKIVPSPSPLPLSQDANLIRNPTMDMTVYNSNELYPHDWCGYHVGVGLNSKAKRVTHLIINSFPLRYNPVTGKILLAKKINIEIKYDNPITDVFTKESTYDLVIITPAKFSGEAQRLADHKNIFGMNTTLKTTESIYEEYPFTAYRDNAEKIKFFIKDAIEDWGITYVLLFGGLKSILYADYKDDINHGSKGWYVPVRFSNFQWDGAPSYNFTSGEPGYLCDLYFADIYKEGGVFDDWDSNGNDIFAEWSGDHLDELDLYPDVAVGRLAVRNTKEAKDVVNKIINYEKQPADPSWFKRMISISGDGFLDQEDWNIQWDTKGLPDGEYIIYAQSSNPEGDKGPIDEIHITLDKTVSTNITFNHDDHLKEELQNGYPAPPIAEIMTISNGNTLGNDDYEYTPNDGQAYCNDLYWYANISYIDEVLTIRGKSYDPKPYGNLTDIELWINNSVGTTVFTYNLEDTETYYEGEWIVGEKILRGRAGALYYMPSDWDNNVVFTSNGKWFDQSDVIEEFSKGYGLAFFSGHGSPGWWGDHYPGIPGNRRHGQVAGLLVTQITPYFPYLNFPLFPMLRLKNTNKLPVVCVGGCHNSMFYVSLLPAIMHRYNQNWMFTYGTPVPECWGWFMVKLPKTGAIATFGNTGYGWGSEGDVCTIGTGDGWINTEFFRQYGQENQDILGMASSQSISNYITHHKTFQLKYWRHDYGWDGIDQKTVQQWQLLGDPSLKIGGYS
ncbi:peptidase C25 [Thermoplasmatales archaeon SG8-52-1]|nr:MAG: peptidase C25 [Thermoplasmatales archaeon SG8-52-1]